MLGGENALPCFSPNGVDATALERIVYNTQVASLLLLKLIQAISRATRHYILRSTFSHYDTAGISVLASSSFQCIAVLQPNRKPPT